MFNWYGNHKIGIIGTSNCGKTVFLTSLLWHLQAHNPDRFVCAQITDCKIKEDKLKPFNYEKNKNNFVRLKKWPDKTTDYSKITCEYDREDCKLRRKVTFVDIPGERMADVQIWQCKNYIDWCDNLFKFWDNDPILKSIADEYCANLNKIQHLTESDALKLYKDLLKKFLLKYCPVTPSTYFLSSSGDMLKQEDFIENKHYDRAIWTDGDFVPLPENLRSKELIKNFEKRYKDYRKKVINPLFGEIDSCDNFIVCVDIFDILNAGARALYQCEHEIITFFEKVKPHKFMSLYNKIGKNPPRIAFIATKSDLVTGKNVDNLESLLSEVIARCKSKNIKSEIFTCSAFISTEKINDEEVIGCYENAKFSVPKELPEEWPRDWEAGKYKFFKVSPQEYYNKAPEHINLDEIFNFITEDEQLGS